MIQGIVDTDGLEESMYNFVIVFFPAAPESGRKLWAIDVQNYPQDPPAGGKEIVLVQRHTVAEARHVARRIAEALVPLVGDERSPDMKRIETFLRKHLSDVFRIEIVAQ